MARVHLGIGSNLGDREAYLAYAVDRLHLVDPRLTLSPVYETSPVGGPDSQGPYLNCVVRLEMALEPHAVLELVRSIESGAGRVRGERWGPRTLDVDILLIEGVEQDEPDLVLPHPRMWERAFVLAPLEDIDPGLVPADWRDKLGGGDAVARAVRRTDSPVEDQHGPAEHQLGRQPG